MRRRGEEQGKGGGAGRSVEDWAEAGAGGASAGSARRGEGAGAALGRRGERGELAGGRGHGPTEAEDLRTGRPASASASGARHKVRSVGPGGRQGRQAGVGPGPGTGEKWGGGTAHVCCGARRVRGAGGGDRGGQAVAGAEGVGSENRTWTRPRGGSAQAGVCSRRRVEGSRRTVARQQM